MRWDGWIRRRLSGSNERVKTRSSRVRLELESGIALPCRRLPPRAALDYRAHVNRIAGPETLVEQPIPDLRLPSSEGGTFGLRDRVGIGPLVLFFYIHNATPG